MTGEAVSSRRKPGAPVEQADRCQARNRRRVQCGRWVSPGMGVCHYHGGALGSGAPVGNQNAYKHGLRAETGNVHPRIRERVQEFMEREGLKVEIAMMRAKIDDAYEQEVGLTVFARGTEGLARLVKAERGLNQRSEEAAFDALANMVEDVARNLGLGPFLE